MTTYPYPYKFHSVLGVITSLVGVHRMCLKCYLFTWDLLLNRPKSSCFLRHALRSAVLHDHSSIFVQISLTDAQEQADERGAIKCYLDVTLLLRICSSRDQANLLFDHTIDF